MRITRLRAVAAAVTTITLLAGPARAATTSTSSTATATATPPVAGAERFEGGWAVPISTAAPAWFDKAYYAQAVAAGYNGVRVPAGVSMPAAAGTDFMPGIHPGTWLITLLDQGYLFAFCSANFVFKKSTTYGVGTAGHQARNDLIGRII